jgi:O-antigen/teichoic acid export membrane protein
MGEVSRQSLIFFLGTIFTTGASYLFKIYVARKLGAEQLGIYVIGMSVTGLLGLFPVLGLPDAASRFVAVYTAKSRMSHLRGFLVRGLLLLISMNLLLGGAIFLARHWIADRLYHLPVLSAYMPLFVILMCCGALTTFLGCVLAGYKDVARRTLITNFFGTPLMMVLAIALLMWGAGLWGYVMAQVIAATLVVGALAWSVWKRTPTEARRSHTPILPLQPEVYSFSAAVLGVAILEFLMGQTDKLLLGLYLDPRWVGIYGVAVGIVAFVPIILQSVNQIFAPTIADLHSRGEVEMLGRLYQTLTKWIIALTIPLAVVIVFFSMPLMRLFGADFEPGWPVLVIGTLGQLVNCGVGSVGILLLMSGNQRRLIKVQAAMAAVAVIAGMILIPVAGMIGAAIASTLVTVGTNLWYMREVKHALRTQPWNRRYIPLLVPCAATLAFVALLRFAAPLVTQEWLLILAALVSAYAVFAIVTFACALDAEDRVIAGAAWMRIRAMLGKAVAA